MTNVNISETDALVLDGNRAALSSLGPLLSLDKAAGILKTTTRVIADANRRGEIGR